MTLLKGTYPHRLNPQPHLRRAVPIGYFSGNWRVSGVEDGVATNYPDQMFYIPASVTRLNIVARIRHVSGNNDSYSGHWWHGQFLAYRLRHPLPLSLFGNALSGIPRTCATASGLPALTIERASPVQTVKRYLHRGSA